MVLRSNKLHEAIICIVVHHPTQNLNFQFYRNLVPATYVFLSFFCLHGPDQYFRTESDYNTSNSFKLHLLTQTFVWIKFGAPYVHLPLTNRL